MQAYLRVVSGPDAGRTFDLTEGVKLVIGRGEKSDTRLANATISRLHYVLLTGKPPFESKSLVETIAAIRQSVPVPLKKFQLSIPDQLQDAVMTMPAKRPEMRFQTPAEAARALERVAKFQGIPL